MADQDAEVPEPENIVPAEEGTPGEKGRQGEGGPPPPGLEPHHALNNPVTDPDPTEWPDPYDKREDPRDPPDPDGEPFGENPHVIPGATSTSEPHPRQDIEAGETEPPERDKLDD